jgi:hypothetical protein
VGSWSMHIHGHGIHDNGKPWDADTLLREFVADLRKAGHVIHGAHFTAGSAQDVTEAADPAPAGPGVFGPFEKVESPPADAPAAPAPEPASTEPAS